MKILVVLFSLILLSSPLLAGIAFAAVEEGDKEISVFGSLVNQDFESSETTTITLQLTGGLFISDNGQVGGSFTNISIFNSFDVTIQIFSGFYKHHFTPEKEVVPYVGGQAGLAMIDFGGESSSSISYGGMAGFKYFVSEDLSFNGEFNLLFTTFEVAGVDVDVTQTSILAGMSYYF